MVETIQCPSCQARYGLRVERVRREHRRAQCFRCGDAFHIESEVARLLGLDEAEGSPTATAQMRILVPHHAPKAPPTQEEIAEHMGSALTLSDLTDEELSGETKPLAPLAAAPLPDEGHEEGVFSSASDAISRLMAGAPTPAPAMLTPPPSMPVPVDVDAGLAALEDTLGGVMPEELSVPPVEAASAASMTLPDLPPPPAAEATAPAAEAAPAQEMETESGYKSAKDAMSKIFGDLPPLPSPVTGLGGGDSPAATNTGLNLDFPEMGATKRMSIEEMQKAMEAEFPQSTPPPASAPAASSLPAPKPGAPAPVGAVGRTTTGSFKVGMPELSPDEVTMVMQPPTPAPATAPNPHATAPLGAPPATDDPNMLRLKIGDQEFKGLTLETLTKWVEEGRVVEEHLVARQFSDNWIEAAKVPGLRPVFERLRRTRLGMDMSAPPTSAVEPAAKKSLFGGLFGKKES